MNQMIEGVMALSLVVASFLFAAWIIWMVSRHRRERQQRDIELRSRMLEKFGTSEEFVQFMQTDAGKRFLDTANAKAGKSMQGRVASSLSTGAILIFLSLAFFFLSWTQNISGLMFPSAIIGAIGVGSTVSALIHWRLGPNEPDNAD